MINQQTVPKPQTVLLVDDDIGIQQTVSAYLAGHGYRMEVAGDGRAMDRMLNDLDPDLIILDVMLPGEDGLTICKRLNRTGRPGVIIASAAGDEADRVIGLELGADDYLPKPFSPRELLARVRAVLRRREDGFVSDRDPPSEDMGVNGFLFEPLTRRLVAPSGVSVMLTGSEAALLNHLLTHRGQILTRDGPGSTGAEAGSDRPSGRNLDVLVGRLRRKLGAHGGGDVIETVYGQGYILTADIQRQ